MFHLSLSLKLSPPRTSLSFLLDLFHYIILILIRTTCRMLDLKTKTTTTTLFPEQHTPLRPTHTATDPTTSTATPYFSPANNLSPYTPSPSPYDPSSPQCIKLSCIVSSIGTIVHEYGNIYSLAVTGNMLYTGLDCKKVTIWTNMKKFHSFNMSSGLVKAIVVSGNKLFTGHQDGRVRVWKVHDKNIKLCKRIGTFPAKKDVLKSSLNPKNYIRILDNGSSSMIKHRDTVSCVSLDENGGVLYTGSWDKTVKVWRVSDFKCLETVEGHEDAVNGVVAGNGGVVFTGSADGTVKMWQRGWRGKVCKHELVEVLLEQENAVTAVAAESAAAEIVYCGSSEGLVRCWERGGKRVVIGGALRGHKIAVLCLAAAAAEGGGGGVVVSGSADKSVCVWKRGEGGVHTMLALMTGHGGPVKCLAVKKDDVEESKDGQRWVVYSGSLDRSVRIWRVCDHAPDLKPLKDVSACG